MNNFTKEELEDIKYLIDDYESHYGEYGDTGLRSKVTDMIDNYCEHEWENVCCACAFDQIYCYKCEKNMGDLPARNYDDCK